MSTGYCNVCEKKVLVQDNRFIEHTDRRNRICYGSFTPAYDINPFVAPRKKRTAGDAFGLQPVDLNLPYSVESVQEDQFFAELEAMENANGT